MNPTPSAPSTPSDAIRTAPDHAAQSPGAVVGSPSGAAKGATANTGVSVNIDKTRPGTARPQSLATFLSRRSG